MDDARFEQLLGPYVEGRATLEEITELESLLRQDAALRRAFVERVRVHVDLHALFEGSREEAATPKPPPRRWTRQSVGRPLRRNWTPGLIAAAALFLVTVSFVGLRDGSDRSRADLEARMRAEREAQAKRKAERARADESRWQLDEIDRQRNHLLKPRAPEKEPDPVKDEDRKKALSELDDRRRRIEEEMKAAVERERKIVAAPPERKPAPPQELPRVPAPTEVTVATVVKVQGEAYVLARGERKPAAAGLEIREGQGLESSPANGRVEIRYPDRSRLEIGPGTVVREFRAEGGKRLTVDRGTATAEVQKQPKDQPIVFLTPHGEATVLGTTLRIIIDPDPKRGTRLEVTEGKVQLKNLVGKPVDVISGHYAVAATGVELAAKRLPLDEILLLPKHGRIVGQSWKKVKDDRASTGEALELLRIPGPNPRSKEDSVAYMKAVHVTFTFDADAEKDYFVWVRGRCATPERLRSQDELGLEVPGGLFNNADKQLAALGFSVAVFQGYSDREGYWWVGGNADLNPPDPRPDDVRPTTIRFTQPGHKTVRLYATEVPMRVDAIWLSATQKTRPVDSEQGPGSQRK